MKPKQLKNTEYPDSWVQVTLYGFSWYWINTQTGDLFNERSGKFSQGTLNKGYLRYGLKDGPRLRKSLYAHQLVYYSFHNYVDIPEELEIDHIDRIRQNNCIDNLRLVTPRQNAQNLGSPLPPGVSWIKNRLKYRACIRFQGKQYCLGFFNTPEAASKAYQKVEQQIAEGIFNPKDWITPSKKKATSKYPGISRKGTKWQAKYKNCYLGLHDTEELAYQAYCNKKGIECVL